MRRRLRRRTKWQDTSLGNEAAFEIRTHPDSGAPTLWVGGEDDEWYELYAHDPAFARDLADNATKWAGALDTWEKASPEGQDPDQ